jgi:Fe-S-cluster-containing dehydrogenase component
MGYVFVMGNCIGCGKPFAFNPHRVPSVRVNGVREPICRVCVERANPLRVAKGLEPIIIFEDSYRPMPEEEL